VQFYILFLCDQIRRKKSNKAPYDILFTISAKMPRVIFYINSNPYFSVWDYVPAVVDFFPKTLRNDVMFLKIFSPKIGEKIAFCDSKQS
jgi:hypothetical protein